MVKRFGFIAVAAAVLSGCVSFTPTTRTQTPVVTNSGFAEGLWQQGTVATYQFRNGNFIGTANDTGNQVANGTYRYISNNTIQISSFSTVQQKTIVANCLLVGTGTTLNCTNDTGLNFSLFRSSAAI